MCSDCANSAGSKASTVTIEYRWAEGRSERFAEIAAEFVRLNVDVILTHNTPPVLAAKQATSVIPIVFATAADPVGTGLVASLARPGGNVTGLSSQTTDIAGKADRTFARGCPRSSPVRRSWPIPTIPMSPWSYTRFRQQHARFGLEVDMFEIRRAEDIAPAFEALKGRAEALYVMPDPVMFTHRLRINTLALGARLPTMHSLREYVEASGLISYGPNLSDQLRRAGRLRRQNFARARKPADLPVEQPTKFDLVINLTTAKALGLNVPPTLLARADEVIE